MLLSELNDLRGRIDTTREWAADFGGDEVQVVARLPETRAGELESKLVPELRKYVKTLETAVDAVAARSAQLKAAVDGRRETARRLKQSESGARAHMKAKARELKRLLKAKNQAEIARIKAEERQLADQQQIADALTDAQSDAASLVRDVNAKVAEAQSAHASAVALASEYSELREALAAVEREQSAAQRALPGTTSSDAMWSAIDQRRDTLNGCKRRAAALHERLAALQKVQKALVGESASLRDFHATGVRELAALRERAAAQPQCPTIAAANASADATQSELSECARSLDSLSRVSASFTTTIGALGEADHAVSSKDSELRSADAESERALRGIAKKQAALDKSKRREQAAASRSKRATKGEAAGRSGAPSAATRVFGVPLIELERRAIAQHRGQGPPPMLAVVEQPLSWVAQYALQREGLFRLSGDKNSIDRLKAEYDAGRAPQLSATMNPHDVTGVFKLWLRELPEPLLTFDGYAHFLHYRQDPNSLRQLVGQLPGSNRTVLVRIVALLVQVLQYEAHNKMTAHNLSVVFGPPLLRAPGDDPMASMQDMQKINEVCSVCSLLFGPLVLCSYNLFFDRLQTVCSKHALECQHDFRTGAASRPSATTATLISPWHIAFQFGSKAVQEWRCFKFAISGLPLFSSHFSK